MAQIASVNVSTVPSIPWKNGGGSTKAIAVFPPNAGLEDFIWRVSVAEITKSCVYSIFPEIDRTQVLIEGESLTLRDQTGLSKRLLAFEPFLFKGEQDWHAEPEGDCQMLNVMTSRTGSLSALEIVRGDIKCVGDGRHHVLMVVNGEYVNEYDSQCFVPGDLIQPQLTIGELLALKACSGAMIVAIRFSLLSK
jgi:uncharacterized protein